MSAVVRLSSKLAGDEETNGLDALAGDLVDNPDILRVAIVIFDAAKVTYDTDTHAHLPTVRLRRFEPVGTVTDASKAIRVALAEAAEKRTGRTPLPIDVVGGDNTLDGQ